MWLAKDYRCTKDSAATTSNTYEDSLDSGNLKRESRRAAEAQVHRDSVSDVILYHGRMCWMSSNTEEWQGLQ